MESAESEQLVATDGEISFTPKTQVEQSDTAASIEPPNLEEKQTEETQKESKKSENQETSENENSNLELATENNKNEVHESANDKNDEKDGINTTNVDALCEAEVEKNLSDLENKVKDMLEELENTTNTTSESLLGGMDLNDIAQLHDELNELETPNEAGNAEVAHEQPQNDVKDSDREECDSQEESIDADDDDEDDVGFAMPLEVEIAESPSNEMESNEEFTNSIINDVNNTDNCSAEEFLEAVSPEKTPLVEQLERPPEKEQNEVNPNMSILETTLKNGKETETPKSSNGTPQESNATKSNQMQPPAAPDLIVRYVIQDGVLLELADCPASGTENSHMEFCLQQDSLCNLVSASIESSLTVDTTKQVDQDASLVQHLLLSEPGITSFKVIEGIFKDIKDLSTTEYLLLYSKLHAKCNEINPAALATAFDMKRKTKIAENPEINAKVQDMTKSILNQTSIDTVEKIFKKMETVNPNELLFLHMALPKGYKNIKDTLRVTTISCRPIVSQTIMYLRTHYEEIPGVLTCKPEVFKDYQNFCEKNQIKPCGIPDFGKIIKRIYPKIFHRRQVVKGKTQYFYCGLKRRYQLPTPKLPPVTSKSEVKEVSYHNTGCCAVYVYMHNLKYRQLSMKDYLNPSSHEPPAKKHRPSKDPDFYKKGDLVNGKSILVHDPLELLSLSMNDSQTTAKDQAHTKRKERTENRKEKPSLPQTPAVREQTNTTPTSRSNGRVLKVKFKQYMHPSVKNLMNKFENVILPNDLYKSHVNPVVVLNNKALRNWCAANIEKFIHQISNINIVKNSDSSKLKVKYECCDKTLKVNQYYGEQLRDLKRELQNLEITKYRNSDDYSVMYVYPPENLPDLLQLSERFTKKSLKKNLSRHSQNSISKVVDKTNKSKICSIFSAIKNKHKTVEKLLEKVDNINLPEQILTSNIEPVVSLDSGEVTHWFEERLQFLKYKMENPNEDDDEDEEVKEDSSNLCETEMPVVDVNDTLLINEDNPTPIVADLNLNDVTTPRPPSTTIVEDAPPPKKPFHLSDIINGTEHKKTVVESKDCKITELTCYFCLKEFPNEKELQNHCDIHLRCRTCKRRLSNIRAMIDHLVKHCFMNNAKCAPNLILPRIDQINLVVNKYPGAFDPSYVPPDKPKETTQNATVRRKISCITQFPPAILNFNNVDQDLEQILPTASANATNNNKVRSVQTYSKSQKSANVRLSKPNTPEISHYQITTNPFKNINELQTLQQTTTHLKSTISNNFNRIFLLSNNPSTPQPDSSNIVYGFYLNNRSDRSSPICLNNFNRVGSDCALNTTPSCSIAESTNFMQIVETPNTPLPQPTYDPTMISDNLPPFEQHQDHSYFQQPVFQVNNDVPNLSNGLINGTSQQNIHPNSIYDMTFLNNINSDTQHVNTLVSPVNKSESTNSTPSSMPGQFRIRVKDIRELS